MEVFFVVALIVPFAVMGYTAAARYERQTGHAPWGLPPGVWALIFGLSLVLGVLLFDSATGGRALEGTWAARLGRLRLSWLARAFLNSMAVLFGCLLLISGVAGLISGPERPVMAVLVVVGIALLSAVALAWRRSRMGRRTDREPRSASNGPSGAA